MRRATGSQSTPPPPGDSHTPTPKGGGSGRECCHDSRGTPTGEWESEHSSIESELDQRFRAQIEAAREKLAARKETRTRFSQNRRYGLAKRHAIKEERTK